MTANPTTSSETSGKFLTVNDNGDVRLSQKLSALAMQIQPASERQWADYVFAPTYRLQPLSEVEQYIQQNKHLPGVPAAAEMVSTSVDLTSLLATLVKKNEELTLHLISHQKRIECIVAGQLHGLNRQPDIPKAKNSRDDDNRSHRQILG